MTTLSASAAALIGTLVQSVLYGLYLAIFLGSLYVTHKKRHKGDLVGINVFLLIMNIILFFLITADWVIQFFRIADAFVYAIDGTPDNYYQDVGALKSTVAIALHVGQTIIADSAMVYRLYIVWGRSWRVIFLPLVLTVGLIGTGCGVIYSFNSIRARQPGPYPTLPSWSISITASFFGATLILNLAISGLISHRIWSINRWVSGPIGQRKTNSVVYILLENAMLYVACLTCNLVGFALGSAYQFIPLYATGPIIGISFCLLIVWVGLGMGIESTSQVRSELRFNHSNSARRMSSIYV